MATYTFDGVALKSGSKTIANIKGANIREGTGGHVLANLKGDQIREGTGSHVLANIRGDDICHGSGSQRIATMRDVEGAISGPGLAIKAALWFVCCR